MVATFGNNILLDFSAMSSSKQVGDGARFQAVWFGKGLGQVIGYIMVVEQKKGWGWTFHRSTYIETAMNYKIEGLKS